MRLRLFTDILTLLDSVFCVIIVIALVAFMKNTFCSATKRNGLLVITLSYQNCEATEQLLNFATFLVTVAICQI